MRSACIGLLILASQCISQTLDVDVNVPRPLNDALLQLEQRLRIHLIYEETIYVNSKDMLTKTIPNGTQYKYPRGGHLQVQIPTNTTDKNLVVQQLLSVHRSLNLPGVYQTIPRGK